MPKGIYQHKTNQGFQKGHKINVGNKSYLWKGDKVSYFALHHWVKRWKGRIEKCEICGTETAKKYEWANIDHKYRRVLDDYIRVCTPCHRNYDKELGIKIN